MVLTMIQSLNENQFKTLTDLAEVVQKRIIGLLLNLYLEFSSVCIFNVCIVQMVTISYFAGELSHREE